MTLCLTVVFELHSVDLKRIASPWLFVPTSSNDAFHLFQLQDLGHPPKELAGETVSLCLSVLIVGVYQSDSHRLFVS